jgi:hypothetical protein
MAKMARTVENTVPQHVRWPNSVEFIHSSYMLEGRIAPVRDLSDKFSKASLLRDNHILGGLV